MSNQTLEICRCTKSDTVIVAGRFTTTGTVIEGAPDFTVASGGSGVYTITFAKYYTKLLSFVATVGAATPNNVDTYTITRDDFASGNTLPITTSEGGTPTDLDTSEYVDFIAVFRETDI